MSVDEGVNVILIAIDTLRASHLSCYGYEKSTSPNIDKLASEGVLFSNCFAPAIPTHPAFTTILTGVHPLTHRIVCHAGKVDLSPFIPLVTEILRDRGYVTAAVDNLVRTGRFARAGWFARGYDYYLNPGGITVISKGVKVNADKVNSLATWFLDWFHERHGDKRFFLFLHYWDPHAPYLPPEEYIDRFYKGDPTEGDLEGRLKKTLWGREACLKGWLGRLIREKGIRDKAYVDASYDAEIAYVDERVGQLLRKLEELGIEDDTLVILTSDHGEGLGDNDVYYDHHGLYDWDIRVPLIMRFPQRLPKGARVDALVQQTDIVPTILEIAGIPIPEYISGRSLLSIFDKEWRGYSAIYTMENTRMTKRAIRTRRWKLIEAIRPDIYGRPAGHLELYDLSKDPEEKENLTDTDEDLALSLLGRLEKWYRATLKGKGDPLIEQEISLPLE